MYRYENHKEQILTPAGQRRLLSVWTCVLRELAGHPNISVRMQELMDAAGFISSWDQMAYADYLVELGVLREVSPAAVLSQHRTFVRTWRE